MNSTVSIGNFSISLNVQNLQASKSFYADLGFAQIGGDGEDWASVDNGDCKIGLFHGMFDKNMLTFNPGWDRHGEPLASFTDARQLQASLKKKGVAITSEADESSSGPASMMLVDPDGNPILIDQL